MDKPEMDNAIFESIEVYGNRCWNAGLDAGLRAAEEIKDMLEPGYRHPLRGSKYKYAGLIIDAALEQRYKP